MEKIIEKYGRYAENQEENWKSRLTWMGLNGREPKHTTTILKFNEETDAFANMADFENTLAYFHEIEKLSDVYVGWVKSKNKGYSDKEYNDMRNFFIGAMGEVFFFQLFEKVKCLIVPNAENEYTRYDFSHVSPTLKNEKDCGVDFTGIANDVPSVIQIKFWNPFSNKRQNKIDIIQKAYAEGISNDWIDKNENNNVFICNLNNEDSIYRCVKEYKQYKNNIVAIGMKTLKESIDNRNKVFWVEFKNYLSKLGR